MHGFGVGCSDLSLRYTPIKNTVDGSMRKYLDPGQNGGPFDYFRLDISRVIIFSASFIHTNNRCKHTKV